MKKKQRWESKITIVIPTHNGIYFLRRNLSYLNSFKLKLNVFVADSSRDENKLINTEIIRSMEYLEITHFKNFPENIKPFFKWLKVIKKVKTKYAVLCADDDLISISAVKESIHFLDDNPNYIAAEGKNIFFVSTKLSRINLFNWREGDAWDSYDSDLPLERLKKLSLNYQPILYAVYRTNMLYYGFEKALDTKSIEFPFGEFIPAFLTVIKSKVRRLNIFYAARDKTLDFQRSNPPINFIQQYIEDNTFNNRYNLFKQSLVREMGLATPLNRLNSEIVVNQSMGYFFKTLQYKKYTVFFKKITRNNIFFVRLYFLFKWAHITLRKRYILSIMLKNNPDFNRMKWFIRNYPIEKKPHNEKFIK